MKSQAITVSPKCLSLVQLVAGVLNTTWFDLIHYTHHISIIKRFLFVIYRIILHSKSKSIMENKILFL